MMYCEFGKNKIPNAAMPIMVEFPFFNFSNRMIKLKIKKGTQAKNKFQSRKLYMRLVSDTILVKTSATHRIERAISP